MKGADRCGRCNGSLRVTKDQYGTYVSCWNCGDSRDLPGVDEKPDGPYAKAYVNPRRQNRPKPMPARVHRDRPTS